MPNLQSEPMPVPNTHLSTVGDCLPTLQKQLEEVEEINFALKKLLVKFENTLVEEGIRKQIETLERWMESYRHGLSAASKISNIGLGWLGELRDHLSLSADEIHRLEDEGGNPVTNEQAAKADALMKATRSLDKVIPIMEGLFGHGDIIGHSENTSS